MTTQEIMEHSRARISEQSKRYVNMGLSISLMMENAMKGRNADDVIKDLGISKKRLNAWRLGLYNFTLREIVEIEVYFNIKILI